MAITSAIHYSGSLAQKYERGSPPLHLKSIDSKLSSKVASQLFTLQYNAPLY